jgi:hypothetical protein
MGDEPRLILLVLRSFDKLWMQDEGEGRDDGERKWHQSQVRFG